MANRLLSGKKIPLLISYPTISGRFKLKSSMGKPCENLFVLSSSFYGNESMQAHKAKISTSKQKFSGVAAASCSERTVVKSKFEAVLVDIGGTLLQTAKPVPETYKIIGKKYGVIKSAHEIKQGFRKAFSNPWHKPLRYEGDGREFWKYAVALATGCDNQDFFEELYTHYAGGHAWTVAPAAVECLLKMKKAGMKLGIVSNFDNRLRPILEDLQINSLFDSIIVSSEIGFEKPDEEIFKAALAELQIQDPSLAVHIGDDPIADKDGAINAGMSAWLWKGDVFTFEEVAKRVLTE